MFPENYQAYNENMKETDSDNENMQAISNFVIVKNWDRKIDSLKNHPFITTLSQNIGFNLPTLVATLTRIFPQDIEFKPEVVNDEKIEDVAIETIEEVNGRPLDRLLVIAYPAAANPNIKKMTKFKSGGEVILVTGGEAEITYATETAEGFIPKSSLKTEKVTAGDLIISADTPNNWTSISGENFAFMYFVGNPNGPQKYGDIPKEKILII